MGAPEAAARDRPQTAAVALDDTARELLAIVFAAGEIHAGELYDRFQDRTADPPTQRTVRNQLDSLADRGLINADGEAKGRTYRPAPDRVVVTTGRASDVFHRLDVEGSAECGRAGEETREMDPADAVVFHGPCARCYGEESSAGGSPHPSIAALENADPDEYP
jgi:Fe2+ or Zn2+ uptake regulation protein